MLIDVYLGMVKGMTKTGSDYAAAKLIGISPQAFNNIKKTKTCDNYVSFRIAELLGLDPSVVIADIESQKTGIRANPEYFRKHKRKKKKSKKVLQGMNLHLFGSESNRVI